MALTVEDGSIVAGAESYCTVAFADTYHTNRGNTAWTGTDAVKEAALRKATDYMLQVYRDRWQGYRAEDGQPLDWPRGWVVVDGFAVDNDIVPTEVKNACAELALRSLSANLYADQGQLKSRIKVGPIETEYAAGSGQTKRYPAIESMLRPYLAHPAGTLTAIRS